MRNLKRVLSLALALVMVLGMMVIGTSAATFTDAEEITYTEAVEVMEALGILQGYNGTFNPKGNLNRAGAAKLIAFMTMGADADNYLTGSAAPFTDVPADHWAAKYVAYCSNLKIINGNGDGTFNPDGNISVVGFAKLVLGAIGVEGTFTGNGWEDAVQKAVADVAELKATGIKVTTADITREEAAALMLAGMKVPAEGFGFDVIVDDEVVENFASLLDAKLYAADVNAVLGADTATVAPAQASGYLLEDNYDVVYYNDYDKAGRPGVRYEYIGADEETEINLFYANAALAKFEGPVAEGDIFAAAKVTNRQTTQISYNIVQDGVDIDAWGDWTADKAIEDVQNHAKWTAAGTGYGIKSELYKDFDGSYYLVAIREYLGKVTNVIPADEKDPTSKRAIEITLDKVPTACESTKVFTKTTEDFAKNDVVVVTMEGASVATVAVAETVKGVVTEVNEGTYTIGEGKYVQSQNSTATVPTMDGKEYEWYVDSFGNLIGNKSAQQQGEPTYYYGYLLSYAKQAYAPAGATNDLLGQGSKEVEAKEIFKFVNAAGEIVTLNGAVKVNEDGTTTFAQTNFFYTPADATAGTSADFTKNVLFRYELDKDGNIKAASTPSRAWATSDGSLVAGKAQIKKGENDVFGKFLTDETVVFLETTKQNGSKEYKVYNGYKNVPSASFTGDVYAYYDGNELIAVVFHAGALTVERPEGDDHVVYFADAKYASKWDAAANDGEGAIVYTYSNVYVDGVKTALTFEEPQDVDAGAMYAYNTETGIAAGDLLSSTAVTAIQSGYVRAGGFYYVDETTEYFQITNTGIVAVEGLPALKDYTVTLKFAGEPAQNSDITPVVYFTAVEK